MLVKYNCPEPTKLYGTLEVDAVTEKSMLREGDMQCGEIELEEAHELVTQVQAGDHDEGL